VKIEVYSPAIRRKEMDAVLTALVRDKVGPGDQARLLVQTAREHLGFDYCLALRSPALALRVALKALRLAPGSGILVSPFSPRYYGLVIRGLGLEPVLCDVLPGTPFMGRETIEAAMKERPGGVEPRCAALHHTLGFLPGSEEIAGIGLPLIEDISQSYGSGRASGEEAGGGGVPGRPLTAGAFTILGLEERDMLTGGGGALLYAADKKDAAALRDYGGLPPEYGLPDMNAAMAVVQFREAARNLQKRRLIARQYAQAALGTRHKRFVQDEAREYNNYAFPLILESGMKEVKAYARKKDIAVESAFGNTLAAGGGDEGAGGGEALDRCPQARSLTLRTALFPLHPRLGSAAAEKVARLIQTLP
jgi:dTDP-4-amino-4,6-dideoxygalactose transaminase